MKNVFTFSLISLSVFIAKTLTMAMEDDFDKYICSERTKILQNGEQSYGSCDSDVEASLHAQKVVDEFCMPSFWICLRTCLESAVLCRVLTGLFGVLIWWLELNLKRTETGSNDSAIACQASDRRYNWYFFLKEMVVRYSFAIGIELLFNVIAVKIEMYLYRIPVIGVWKKKWKLIT